VPSAVLKSAQFVPESQRRTVPGCEVVVIHKPFVPQVP
jgi:hypothetical protein